MNTPAAALIWELWARHRKRLLTTIGIIVGFTLVYPTLCAWAGLDLNAPEILDDFVKKIDFAGGPGSATPARVARVLYLLFLTAAPALAMMFSMFYVTWLFTFTEFEAKTRDPLAFPARLFNLPVSTRLLYSLMTGGGMLGVFILYTCWALCVRQPHWEIFNVFQNCFAWMTLLALAQAIVWGLAGWPLLRAFALAGLLWGFLAMPALREWAAWPFILVPLFAQGLLVSFAGLQNMRNGQWQGRRLRWPFTDLFNRDKMAGPFRFASVNDAQIWFEWRRVGKPLFLTVASLTLAPVLVAIPLRIAFAWPPLEADQIGGIAILLMTIPIVVYFLASIAPPKSDNILPLNRPITNGQITMVRLKATAISVALSWIAVLAAIRLLAFVGDLAGAEQRLSSHPFIRMLFVGGLMFFTWRLVAASLCFILTGRRRLCEIPIWILTCASLCGPLTPWLSNQPEFWQAFMRLLPALLLVLLAIKLSLAVVAFKTSIQQKLINRSSVIAYLGLWVALVCAGITGVATAWAIDPGTTLRWFPVVLGIILAVPLARVGLCPRALYMFRHT
jgi:hypothetical protein